MCQCLDEYFKTFDAMYIQTPFQLCVQLPIPMEILKAGNPIADKISASGSLYCQLPLLLKTLHWFQFL